MFFLVTEREEKGLHGGGGGGCECYEGGRREQ